MEYDTNVRKVLLKNLFDNRNQNLCCDFLLISNDNTRIPVHKIVLMSSTSPYLRSLMRAHIEDTLLHIDISSNQLDIIIRYLYTGEVCVSEVSEIKNLYENANLLVLPFLEIYSTKKLLDSLTMNVSLDYFRHSLKFSIEILEEECLNFIADNIEEFFNKFLQDLSLKEIEKIMEIREKLNIEEINLYRFIKKWIFMKYNMRKFYIEKLLLQQIDFHKIPSKIYHDEIETDLELKTHVSFRQQFISLNTIEEIEKQNENEKSIFKTIAQESLYYITLELGIVLKKINIENDNSECDVYVRGKYNKSDCGICNIKYRNKDYILFSGGFEKYPNLTNSNLIWRPIKSDSSNFTEFPSLLEKKANHRSIFFDSQIYVCGGFNSTENLQKQISTKSTEYFDFGKEKWYKGPEFHNTKEWNLFGLTDLDRCLYAFGRGYIEILDPRINKWNVIISKYNHIIVEAFPCSKTSILCIGEREMQSSLIFDIRNNKFTQDMKYDYMEDFKLQDVVKLNDEIYGAYKKKGVGSLEDCYIRKIDNNNYPYDWKIVKNEMRGMTFKLLTIRE